jgi:hypothetical protein
MMASSTAEQAVRMYLIALSDPSSLVDQEQIAALEKQLHDTDDQLERVVVRQQLMEARKPSVERSEDAFVTHAKAWADERGVTARAFTEEGVPAAVLRRAGFSVAGGRGRPAGRSQRGGQRRSRVTVDQIRAAIPKGTFTVKMLEDASGASVASVRKVISEELSGGRIKAQGPDPDHRGPGRAPTLYKA